MLKFIFEWLDLHPGSYWILALAPTLLLVARLVVLIAREFRGPEVPPRGAAWRDALVLFLFLLAWRWPFLLAANEFNPDESQLTAGAMTLAHDPVFWRAVDGGSSGPLNFYFLVPWRWLGAPGSVERHRAEALQAVPLALGDGRRRRAERREQQGLGLVGAGHQDLDRRRPTVGREPHTITEPMCDPVDSADRQTLICGWADGGQPTAGNDCWVTPGAYGVRGR